MLFRDDLKPVVGRSAVDRIKKEKNRWGEEEIRSISDEGPGLTKLLNDKLDGKSRLREVGENCSRLSIP